MKPTNPNQELKKIYRFFKNQVSKYILLVVDDQRILNYLIIQAQVELRKEGKEISHLKLSEDNFSIFRQVGEYLAGNRCNGLIVSNVNTLIYRNEKETIEKLNRSRDAFEQFRIPVIFVLNNDNLKKMISGAADFYQLRDLPDFHFEGTTIGDQEILDINIPQVERYSDSDLKAELLEEQLRIIDKKKKIDKDSLNNIVIPLLNIYIKRGNLNNVKTLFDRYVKDQEKKIEDKLALGNYYAGIHDYEKAILYFEQGKTHLEFLGDKEGVARYYHQVGIIYYYKGDYEMALKQYEKSLEISEKIGNIAGVSSSLHQIGIIYQERGDYEMALMQYEKSLEIKEKIGDIKGISSTLHQIGIISYLKGDYDQALQHHEKSLEIQENIGDISGVAISFNQLGLIRKEKKNHPRALRYFIQAFAIFAKIGSPNVNIVRDNILDVKKKIPAKQFAHILKEFKIPKDSF